MKWFKLYLIIFNLFVFYILYDICINKHSYYTNLFNNENNITFTTSESPRGRIIDSKGNILVDNKGIKSLSFLKIDGITIKEELLIADELSKIIDIDTSNVGDLLLKKYFYLKNKKEIDSRLNNEEIEKYNKRIIDSKELTSLKYLKITKEELNSVDKKAALIFNIMNTGYSYQEKVIKNNLTDEEFVKINEANLDGVSIINKWVRVYNYDTCLNELFGSIGNIPKENLNEYLNNGYKIDSVVGVSFLEKYYEKFLKGQAATYKIDGKKIIKLNDEKRGNDLILGIDINTQLEIERIVKEEILNAKEVLSSKYYNGSYIVLSNPNNGLINALVAYKYEDKTFKSDVIGLLTNSYTVGSVVKGASQTVAYRYNVLNEKTKVKDGCVKLYSQKEKCSWKNLGFLNDITSIAYSSNYFQFINAIKVAGQTYKRGMKFNVGEDDFNKYRNVFKEFGLGIKTGIDLYEEQLGITGNKITGDLLLNLSIGQYDTYTPLMINQYISTIANDGVRLKLSLVSDVIKDGKKVSLLDDNVLNKVSVDKKYIKRVKTALNSVSKYGTGTGYIKNFESAGKTGTSETFYRGHKTTTKSYISFFPYDKPEYAYTIISPNIGYENNVTKYVYPINSRISKRISNYLYDIRNIN